LKRLAEEGPDYFTTGDWAQKFVAEVNRTGGKISLEEIAGYRVRWVKPVEFTYKGHSLRGAPPASTAGLLNGMIFNILENFDLKKKGHYTESSESLVLIRKAYDLAQMYTSRFIGDPYTFRNPVEHLLSKDFGNALARLIPDSWPLVDLGDGSRISGSPALKGDALDASYASPDYSDTNHLVIVDEYGNWVSMTHTVYGSTFGTGLTVDGVGVNSGNNFPGVGIGQGRRVITPFPALMAVDEEGQPWLAIGSPGLSSRAVALTLINLIGYGLEPYASVDAPRFQGYSPYDALHIESRISDSTVQGLAGLGVRVRLSAPYNWHMGSIHLVVRDQKTGELTGVADPRRAGHAAGY
jgi:gamma-glutamyltranspeptidase/glutathione hydrolase